MNIISDMLFDTPIGELIVLYMIIFIPFVLWDKNRREKKEKLFKIIATKVAQAFKNDLIQSNQDIENICKGLLNKNIEIDEILKILQLVSIEFYTNDDSNNNENNKAILVKINKFIDDIKKEEPFSDLPYTEKTVLNNLLSFKENISNNQEGFISKLHDLSHIMKIKYDENNDLLKKNNRSTKISYLVGIVSILVSIYFAWNSNNTINTNKSEKTTIQNKTTSNKSLERETR